MNEEETNVIQLAKKRAGRKKSAPGQPLTNKQERYAQGIAAGRHYAEVFREIYDCRNMQAKTAYKMAGRIKNDPKIKARVTELKGQVAKAIDAKLLGLPAPVSHLPAPVAEAVGKQLDVIADVIVDRRFLTNELLKDSNMARAMGQMSASVAALKEVGKVAGLVFDSRDSQGNSELDRMSAEELRAFIREEIVKDGVLLEGIALLELKAE